MKLTKIANIEALNVEQSINVKGGARDTRSTSTATPSTLTGLITLPGKRK